MKRASYREAIAWVAANDCDGDADRLNEIEVQILITAILVADLFGVSSAKVGRDVVRKRQQNDRIDSGKASK